MIRYTFDYHDNAHLICIHCCEVVGLARIDHNLHIICVQTVLFSAENFDFQNNDYDDMLFDDFLKTRYDNFQIGNGEVSFLYSILYVIFL